MNHYYLKSDALTGGVITRILEDSWRQKSTVSKQDLKALHQVFSDNDMFNEVAENIYVPVSAEKEELEEKLVKGIIAHLERGKKEPENKLNHVKLFPKNGFILKDGIYGSAFGRFNYIYRSKGIRIYWFESGDIEYRAVYATINEYGFQYAAEEVDGCNIFDDLDLSDISCSPLEEAFGTGEILISNLVKIKEDFIRDYPIEYLLYPPDVDKLSSFSIQVREQIWDAIIELIKELALDYNNDKEGLLCYLIEFMESQEIQPSAYHVIELFDFYRENQSKINEKEFFKMMSIVRQSSTPEGLPLPPVNAEELIKELEAIPEGTENANAYHDLIFRCLSIIFDRSLKRGKKEVPMNEGRKRVDIVFDNRDTTGFFAHIRYQNNIPCPKILIECKNYSSDPKNPEVDQLLGRFGDLTGRFGFLVCRKIEDDKLLLKRCRDAVYHRRDFVICLEDKDIKALLKLKETSDEEGIMEYLLYKMDRLILNS